MSLELTIQIEEKKEKARKVSIEVFPDPKTAVILTLQHAGAPNVPLVAVGDSVAIGQKIADSKEKVSAPIHSPISGKVVKFGDTYNSCYQECSEAFISKTMGKGRGQNTAAHLRV